MTSSFDAPSARAELAPAGKLRVGINHSNFLLVNPASPHGAPKGIAPDLALELGKRLGVPVQFVSFDGAGKTADAIRDAEVDAGFIASEAERASVIEFSSAYVELPATYLVPAGSPLRTLADIDRPGVRIAVSGRSAYDLYLSRTLKHAQLVRAGGKSVGTRTFPDHHDYAEADVASLAREATAAGAEVLLTTEKDWVKLARLTAARESTRPILRVDVRIRFQDPAEERRLLDMIQRRITPLS